MKLRRLKDGRWQVMRYDGASLALSYEDWLRALESLSEGRIASLEKIVKTFSLSRDDMARVCGIDPTRIDSLFDPDTPLTEQESHRLFILNLIAGDWQDAGYSRDRVHLNSPLIDGDSVMDLLSQETINRELVLFAGNRIAIRTASIERN